MLNNQRVYVLFGCSCLETSISLHFLQAKDTFFADKKKTNRMKDISDIDVLSFTFRRGLNLIKKVGPFWQMWDLGIHAVETSCPVVSQLCLGV